uniref:ABC-type dipeptide/oligopeptide/nickel transport systems permease components n=1 Tax=Uncultured archaeon GZfos26G2 TaxID=3386331 RepID=Q649J8_UNCAG|nr:ABC-type dipeptide/oligopeptide/nickel transport systems permease components [uncultured archaeon GZfos35A2]
MRKIPGIGTYAIAFLIILALIFLLPRMMPGDPLTAICGEEVLVEMTPELRTELLHRFALDEPLWRQFFVYLTGIMHGDFGYSYYYNAPVLDIILEALPWTLLLVGSSLLLSTVLSIVIGIESGWRRGKISDKSLLTTTMILNGFPNFFIGIILLLFFAVYLGCLPLQGAKTPYSGLYGIDSMLDIARHLVLPLIALTLAQIPGSYLLMRNTMITTLKEPFVRTAKAKGLSEVAVRYKHAGRNAMLPIVTTTGVRVGIIVTGALFIEIIFSYPGVGLLTYNSLFMRDYPILQGVFFIVAVFVILANFVVDLLYTKIDPRIGDDNTEYAH